MEKKYLFGIFMLFLCLCNFVACNKNNELENKYEIIKMYISPETSTYIPPGSNNPIECLLAKEEGARKFSKLSFEGITGFTYEQGHEYVLKVEKQISVAPLADGTRVRYKLLEIMQDTSITPWSPQWTFLIDNRKEHDIDISTSYLGIQIWPALANPPAIYVGAVFPESAFATSFDREVTDEKRPVDLTFNFSNPYLTTLVKVRWSEYLKKIKEAIHSEEYANYMTPDRPYTVQLAELKNLEALGDYFLENQTFGRTLRDICRQKFDMKKVKSLTLGKIVFKGFTVSMDTPADGLFVNMPSNLNELVFVRELTYGTSAYFVIASESPYEDMLSAFKGAFVHEDSRPHGTLHTAQIVLLTVSDVDQTATVNDSFEALADYLKSPFRDEDTYGYPISCRGQYVKDNSWFVKAKR